MSNYLDSQIPMCDYIAQIICTLILQLMLPLLHYWLDQVMWESSRTIGIKKGLDGLDEDNSGDKDDDNAEN